MNIWLVTTGSSDVQLTSNEDWRDWWQAIKTLLYRLPFEPVRAVDDDNEPYRLPARVLGIAHETLPDQVQARLSFPLLQNFAQELKAKAIQIDQIIVLISDQENIFPESERETKRCPYWQDTCQLYPILEDYLKDQFPNAIVKPLILKPQLSKPGLDDWDAVLNLVQQEIESLKFETKLQNVYVSHQAGTPAISSAVQFCGLAKFGDRVRFLVSSEQSTQTPSILPSSSYLKGIRKREALRLWSRHDYSGIETVLEDYLKNNEDLKTLLNAAKNWNLAKFSDFLDCLKHYPKFASEVAERTREENWWWIAYEEAYLAVIREKQDNIVEAFFHSFRAFEYMFAAWGSKNFSNHIENKEDEDKIPVLMDTFLEDPHYLKLSAKSKKSISGIISKLEKRRRKLQINTESTRVDMDTDVNIEEDVEQVELVFFNLANLFKSLNYREYKNDCPELEVFFGKDNVRDRRNLIIHQAKGLSITDLCDYWKILVPEKDDERKESVKQWSDKLLKLLNFIAKDDLEEGFTSLEAASLMAIGHQKLERAIADL